VKRNSGLNQKMDTGAFSAERLAESGPLPPIVLMAIKTSRTDSTETWSWMTVLSSSKGSSDIPIYRRTCSRKHRGRPLQQKDCFQSQHRDLNKPSDCSEWNPSSQRLLFSVFADTFSCRSNLPDSLFPPPSAHFRCEKNRFVYATHHITKKKCNTD